MLAGSINTEYGVFRNECCGDEYVLYRGIRFPNCKKHRDIVTRWHLISPISMALCTPLSRVARTEMMEVLPQIDF